MSLRKAQDLRITGGFLLSNAKFLEKALYDRLYSYLEEF